MFSFHIKDVCTTKHEQQAWIAIVGLVSFLAFLLLLGAGRFLIFAFPAASLAVGVFLYWRTPSLYIGFTYWMYFLGPLIRRLIDYQSGYITPGPLEFSSLLVASVSLITLVRYLPKMINQQCLPFILCLGSVFYGTIIGLIQNPIKDKLMLTLPLMWLSPILFGFHLFINWRDYPSYRKTIQRTFLFGMLVIGFYGLWQFLVAPDWDRFWLTASETGASRGIPEPLGMRVWSTMEGHKQLATAITAALLLLLVNPENFLLLPAAGVGFLAFLLTRSRGPWIGFVVGLLVLIPSLRANLQMRVFVSIVLVAVFAVPLVFAEPFFTGISNRLDTFLSLESDYSLNARVEGYDVLLNQASSELLGKGFGYQIDTGGTDFGRNDSAILLMLFNLGWLGTIAYLCGVLLLLLNLFQGKENRFDVFISAVRAINMAIFVQIWLYLIFIGAVGTIFWGFLGLGLAGRRYHCYQCIATKTDFP